MSRLDELKAQILADGKIDDAEVDLLRRELYADGKIDRNEAEFLIDLRNQAKQTTPAFEKLFFAALMDNILADGAIDKDEAVWLRKMLYADGKIDAGEKQFLTDLKSKARAASPEFQQLFDECMKS